MTPTSTDQAAQLRAMVAIMTPEQLAAFTAIMRAVAAGVVPPTERARLADTARGGGEPLRRLVADLRIRTWQAGRRVGT